MKLTAVPISVMLLVAGISCNTKDKTKTYMPGDNVLAQKPLKEEKATAAPLPNNKKTSARKAGKPKLIDVYIKPGICEGLSSDFDVIPPPIEEDSNSIDNDDSSVLFMCNLESEAEYPGGAEAWRRFLNKNLKLPTDTSGNGISGTVEVQFVIDEEGKVTDVQVICGLEPLSTEAVRVIKKSDKWIPAKRLSTGRYVRSYKKQPFIFRGE